MLLCMRLHLDDAVCETHKLEVLIPRFLLLYHTLLVILLYRCGWLSETLVCHLTFFVTHFFYYGVFYFLGFWKNIEGMSKNVMMTLDQRRITSGNGSRMRSLSQEDVNDVVPVQIFGHAHDPIFHFFVGESNFT